MFKAPAPHLAEAAHPAPQTRLPVAPRAEEPLHEQLLDAFLRVRSAEALLIRAEARDVFHLRRTRGHAALGFSSFADLARELLQMSPRSAHQRAALHETLATWPTLDEAFLSGSITACQALTIRPALSPETVPFWIRLARRLTVEQLRRQVRETSGDAGQSTASGMMDPDPPGDLICFEAPPRVAVAWEDAMEMARRVLGRQAPRYACVEGILSEAGVGLDEAAVEDPAAAPSPSAPVEVRASGPAVDSPAPFGPQAAPASLGGHASPAPLGPHAAPTPLPHPRRRASPGAAARARCTIGLVARELDHLNDLVESTPCDDPNTLVTRLVALCQLARPLRVLTARLLRDLRDSGAMDRLGYGRLQDFVEDRLHLSARTARALVAESLLFEDRPELEAAYATGRIGAVQAVTIERNTTISRMEDQVRRAEQVTCRQFTREMRLLQRLAEFAPDIRARHPGPLPLPGLKDDLFNEIRRFGWTEADIAAGLTTRGAPPPAAVVPAAGAASPAAPAADICTPGANPNDPHDPAENPALMRCLEALVDLLALASDDTAADRQTFARDRRPVRIRFWAPLDIAAHWRAGLQQVRQEVGPIPTWALVTILLARAVRIWERTDPEFRPTGHRIFRRDGWLCQVPGCTARRALEVHHIHYRSRGGSNRGTNRITLCHGHHHHGVHAGVIHVEGEAPHALQWKVGCRSGRPPVWTLIGERKISAKRT